MDDFYANLEDYVRLLQGQGAKVYLVLGVPLHHRFNPGEMVTRSLTGFQIAPDVENASTHRRAASRPCYRQRQTARRRRAHWGDATRSPSRHLRQRRRLLAILRSRRTEILRQRASTPRLRAGASALPRSPVKVTGCRRRDASRPITRRRLHRAPQYGRSGSEGRRVHLRSPDARNVSLPPLHGPGGLTWRGLAALKLANRGERNPPPSMSSRELRGCCRLERLGRKRLGGGAMPPKADAADRDNDGARHHHCFDVQHLQMYS